MQSALNMIDCQPMDRSSLKRVNINKCNKSALEWSSLIYSACCLTYLSRQLDRNDQSGYSLLADNKTEKFFTRLLMACCEWMRSFWYFFIFWKVRLEFIIFIDLIDIIKKGSYLKRAAERRILITFLFSLQSNKNL